MKKEHKDYWAEGESLTLRQEPNGDWKPATPEPYYSSRWERIFCFFGYHSWTWQLEREGNNLILTDEPPAHATCVICKKKYA